ncbi:tripartite tricarboxylate transporter substrate binding protein [Ramlibacter ginsenosidimutans]|uniref:Tripartite tricarboxylate transporter substrate binding protein n=1 Tax=Ramlibacter ginsenosidimutans TaxID=502333 RepID=A0A934TUU5_9BURK|nr:tripartite tricarboxylate transporter substrate binding protein [Ramlibacter ginsenosidimutans]
MRFLFPLLAAACLAVPLGQAQAQGTDWPTHPIRVIVPAPAGGPYDATMRPIAQHMAQTLKQPVIIDNRPSAGNILGTQAGASAAPDGYTLTMTGMLNTLAQAEYAGLHFDIVKDFEHIGTIGGGPQWLVARSDAGIQSVPDLVEQATRNPGKINYASSGAGSTGHLVMELLQRAAGIHLTHVPYKGAAPAMQDVLAGVEPVIVVPSSAALPYVKSGQLRLLAVSSPERSPLIPQAPTFAELGYKQLTMTAWVGLSAPKGTPAPIVRKVNAALDAALKDPSLLQRLDAIGLSPRTSTPAEYAELVRSDTERWGELVRSLHIRAN